MIEKTNINTLLSIKYCGGCNPQIDREKLAASLITRFLASPWLTAKLDIFLAKGKRLHLIINGCPTACAFVSKNIRKEALLIISGPIFEGKKIAIDELVEKIFMKVRNCIETETNL